MGYRDHVYSPEMSLRFYLKIQGIPYIFTSGETPIDVSGSPWSAPTGYTLKPNTLDGSDVQDIGCNVSRISGSASPASILIRLIEDRSYSLGELFAWDKPDGALANLEASFPYETGSGPWSMTVDSTAGFPSSGTLYLGRETMSYSAKTATRFSVDSRTKFDPVGYGDTVYRHNSNLSSAPRVVSDHPRVWIGRYVQLFAHWVSADGYALDTGFDGSNSFECFRGVIRELPRPGSDWASVEFEIEGIDSILRTEVGIETRQGRLYQYTNPLAHDLKPEAVIPPDFIYTVTPTTERVEIQVETGGSLVVDATGPDAYSIHGAFTVPATVETYTTEKLRERFDLSVGVPISSATSNNVKVYAKYSAEKWVVQAKNYHGANTYTITLYCDGVNSFLPLFGMTGTVTVDVSPNSTKTITTGAPGVASVVPASATKIPFFYEQSGNLLSDITPAAPGYAVIGDGDEAEIVSYAAISDISSDVITGLYQMTGVRRGLMNTAARTHVVTMEDATGDNDGAEIRFGAGVENDSFFLTILNLAQSTGDGNHGGYDLFPVGVCQPQAPGHFDEQSFEDAHHSLLPTERTISYFISKPEALSTLAKDWLNPLGRFLFPRVDSSGAYTIGVGRNKPPVPAQSVATLLTSNMHWSDPATYQRGRDMIVTGITVYPAWDFAGESSRDDVKVSVINKDSEAENGLRNVIEWKLRGYSVGPGQALELTKNWAAQLAERHGRGRVVLEIRTDRSAWFINVGDTVALTVPNIPTPEGTRGLSTRYAVVENIVKVYSGDQPGAIIRCVVESSYFANSFRPYAPSAKVTAKSVSLKTITVSANEYSNGGTDADFFTVGDKVIVHNEGERGTVEAKTITAISGNVITLDTAVSLTVGNYTALDFDAYATNTTEQQGGASYIAGSGGNFSNSDAGNRYI